MVALYRLLLHLYPQECREAYGDEMAFVFRQARVDAGRKSLAVRAAFYLREVAGLLLSAVGEHFRFLPELHPLAGRRFTMRSEFRFPKSTTVLMCIVLAGVIISIEKARTIALSVPYSNPYISIHPLRASFAQAIGWIFAAVYAGAIAAWAVLFALRRSGVHRLSELDPGQNSH